MVTFHKSNKYSSTKKMSGIYKKPDVHQLYVNTENQMANLAT